VEDLWQRSDRGGSSDSHMHIRGHTECESTLLMNIISGKTNCKGKEGL